PTNAASEFTSSLHASPASLEARMSDSTKTQTAQQLAIAAADQYFAALASDLPFDVAPGDVNLVELCTEIQDAIDDGKRSETVDPIVELQWREDSALRAGYLLGVQIGLRMRGGAR